MIVGVPMFIFTVVGLHLNITLWRIISVHKVRGNRIDEKLIVVKFPGFIDRNFKRHVISLICSSIGIFFTFVDDLII